MNTRYTPGYIAITTAILLSMTLMVVGLTIAFVAFFSRSGSLASSSKHRSAYAARGCLDQALLNYSLDNTYLGNETVTVEIGPPAITCDILTITTEGTNRVIRATATVNQATTNYILKVHVTTLARVSLEEVASL